MCARHGAKQHARRLKVKRARYCYRARKKSGRCSTLPLRRQSSTIDAEGLNFRVRDGNGCDPFAMATQKTCPRLKTGASQVLRRKQAITAEKDSRSECSSRSLCRDHGSLNPNAKMLWLMKSLELLVPVRCTHYCASTSGLSTW